MINISLYLYVIYTTDIFKSPSFLKKYFKTKKPFSLIAKGLELASSPYWSGSELLKRI